MLHSTDLVIYLWLVPVFFLLFLPLLMAAAGIPLGLARRIFFTGDVVAKEKRSHPRFSSCKDTFAKITVGDTTCTALVTDVSQMGISLQDIPEIFSHSMDKLSVVIRQYGMDYTLMLRTKWVTPTESGKRIGAEIDTASPGWNNFLSQTAKASQL